MDHCVIVMESSRNLRWCPNHQCNAWLPKSEVDRINTLKRLWHHGFSQVMQKHTYLASINILLSSQTKRKQSNTQIDNQTHKFMQCLNQFARRLGLLSMLLCPWTILCACVDMMQQLRSVLYVPKPTFEQTKTSTQPGKQTHLQRSKEAPPVSRTLLVWLFVCWLVCSLVCCWIRQLNSSSFNQHCGGVQFMQF